MTGLHRAATFAPMVEATLRPAATRGHYSLARVSRAWYVACRSSELTDRPIARTILGNPVVLFRSEGKAAALLDRCAHRNVPLSMGWCEGGSLICAYHGWQYAPDGTVNRVPALSGVQTGKGRRVSCFATVERQGLVWVWGEMGEEPAVEPYTIPHLGEAGYGAVSHQSSMEATLHASLENILDVPHTAFLHRGLFRGGRQNTITAVVRRRADSVECEYIGEPRPSGLIGRILAPGGGTVTHFDRFLLPSVAQVEYRLGTNHLVVTNLLTPVSDFVTQLYATVTYRLRLPHPLVRLVLKPLAEKVVGQDISILKAQTEAVQRFGGEQYVSTDVDLLGPHILRLLKRAERGEPGEESVEEQVELKA